jgi:hypothetical protein
VRRDAAEQRTRSLGAESPRRALSRGERRQPEARERERMSRPSQRTEHRRVNPRPILHDPTDHTAIGIRVAVEPARGALDIAMDRGRRTPVQRMREHHRRLDPLETELRQRQRLKQRRRDAERMDGRAEVVHEPGQRQLPGSRAAADGRFGLEDDDLATGLGNHNCRGEPIGAGADDDGVGHMMQSAVDS